MEKVALPARAGDPMSVDDHGAGTLCALTAPAPAETRHTTINAARAANVVFFIAMNVLCLGESSADVQSKDAAESSAPAQKKVARNREFASRQGRSRAANRVTV
jgi:hypothetical protein